MAANTPVAQAIGGTASKGAIALLGLLWALSNNATATYKCLSGQMLMLGDSGRYPEFDIWKGTVGFHPAVLNFLPGYVGTTEAAPAVYVTDSFGRISTQWTDGPTIDGNTLIETMVAHAKQGGVITWETIAGNQPCAYVAGSTMNHAAQTISQLNTAGQITVATATETVFVTTASEGVILATDGGGNNHLHTFTYTSRAGAVLHGVVISANTATGGALTDSVANGAFVGPATLASDTTSLTAAAASGAFPLQYSSTAYQALGGTLTNCTSSGTTVTAAGAVGLLNMPVVPGMYVSDSGGKISAGATVASISGSSFAVTGTISSAITSGETLTFTLGASTDYNAAQAFNSNANFNAMLDNIIVGLLLLEALGIPVLFRPFSEFNSDFWWYSNASTNPCYFQAQAHAYVVGYMTGVQVFAGQPVSSTPVSNTLFGYNLMAGLGGNTTGWWTYCSPYVNSVCYADVATCDSYNGPYNAIGAPVTLNALAADLFNTLNNTSYAGAPPYSPPNLPSWAQNLPQGIGEFYGDANNLPAVGVYFSSTADSDLSTLSMVQGKGYGGSGFQGGLYAGTNAATVATLNSGGTLTFSKGLNACNVSTQGGSGYIQCDDGMHSFTYTSGLGSVLSGVSIAGSTTAKVYTNNIICLSGTVGTLTMTGFRQVAYNYYTRGLPVTGCSWSTSSTTVTVPSGAVNSTPIIGGSSSVGQYVFGAGIPTGTYVVSTNPGANTIVLSATPTIASPSGGGMLQFGSNGTTITSSDIDFNITSTAGVPSGSFGIDPGGASYALGAGLLIGALPSNSGNAACLAALKATNASFIAFETAYANATGAGNQLFQDQPGVSTWMNDPWMVNLEQMAEAATALGCTLPWAQQLQGGTTSPLGAKGMPAMAALATAVR